MSSSNKPIEKFVTPPEEVEIKAELMESWLNGRKIRSLTPKVLFDIQTILRHYKDIIVPDVEVKINYPNDENGAFCSVDKKEVFISTGHLQEGYVDETIGHMIHELNHIKMSDSERQTWSTCYSMVEKVLDSIFVPEDDSDPNSDLVCLKDLVLCDPTLTFDSLYSDDPTDYKYGTFLRYALKDVAFLLNAVEDVRIDTLCAHNLKKYINKGDIRVFSEWGKKYEEGEFNDNTLMNVCYRLLFHHKGFVKDPYISNVFGDTDYILNSSPSEYTPVVLETFKDIIKEHIENLWGRVVDIPSVTIFSTDGDMYMSGMTDSTDGVLKEISGNDSNLITRAKNDVGSIKFADSPLVSNFSRSDAGDEFHRKQEQHAKPKILATDMMAAIHSFQKIKIYDVQENLTDSWNEDKVTSVDYSVVVFDSLH